MCSLQALLWAQPSLGDKILLSPSLLPSGARVLAHCRHQCFVIPLGRVLPQVTVVGGASPVDQRQDVQHGGHVRVAVARCLSRSSRACLQRGTATS